MTHLDNQDPIEQLRMLWVRVEPPILDEGATGELHRNAVEWIDSAMDSAAQDACFAAQELDPSSAAAIAWVRSAWSRTQPPAMPSPPIARMHHHVPTQRGLIAAAAALLIAGLAFTLVPDPVDSVLIARAPETPTVPSQSPPSLPVRIVPAGFELTSGPVRLTLLAQLAPTTNTQD